MQNSSDLAHFEMKILFFLVFFLIFHEKSKLSRQTLPQPKKSNKLYPDEYRRIMENMHPCPVKKSQLANNYSDRKIEINLFYCEKSPFFGPPNPKNLLFLIWKISFFGPQNPKNLLFFQKSPSTF